ncbi:MAG TPA: glycosyltransferase family 39 protein [Terriglobales bacterium]|nr:glycosyltransferase family 39 protein [Terriglobales bacterium]
MATATRESTEVKKPAVSLSKWIYPAALLASLSIWFLALRAPLWLDETLAYWQVSGGLAKVWTRSQLMPSSVGYLYILWFAKSILGSSEMALKIPSLLAMLGAVYFLFRASRELFDQETAFIASIFFCLEMNVTFAATDARPYGFALLATNLAIFAFVRWMSGREVRQALFFGSAAASILYFHYLFSAILPAFAVYYLVARGRSVRQDVRQLAAAVGSFTLLSLPLFVRVAHLYQTRVTHVVQEMHHPFLTALNTLSPLQVLIGFVVVALLAGLVRKIELPGREDWPAILLPFLLALVPAGVLFGVSAVTPAHLVIPRYLTVVAPGSALAWAMLTRCIDSPVLRKLFLVGLVGVTMFETFNSPDSRRHELSFKKSHAFVNANVGRDNATVLVFSAFIESDYEALPIDRKAENALLSQIDYYPINAPIVMLPMDLNDEARRIGSESVIAAAQRRQRFLVIAAPTSYKTVNWLIHYSRGAFDAQMLAELDEIIVVEFRPAAWSE